MLTEPGNNFGTLTYIFANICKLLVRIFMKCGYKSTLNGTRSMFEKVLDVFSKRLSAL